MKKSISLLLCAIIVLSCFVFKLSASAADEAPADVPKVIITTSKTVNTDKYVSCEIKVIDQAGGEFGTVYDADSSFKIRGNSTSSGAKKPFNIKFSGKTDVLGMGKGKKWCLLANCYEKTLIRNQMVFDLAEKMGLEYTPSYRVVDVYLNNKFLGSYLLTDPIEAGETRVDIDNEANEFILERDARTDEGTVYFETPIYGIRFGINEPEEPTSAQYNWLMDFLQDAEAAIASRDYNRVLQYFDEKSMVDFYLLLELSKNVDVNVGSTRFFIKNGKIHGGPAWDFDLSMGNCYANYYTTYNNINTTGLSYQGFWAQTLWFAPLLGISEFKTAVLDRYLELQDDIVNLYSDNALGENYIDVTTEKYQGTINRNYKEAGWSVSKMYSTLERVPDSTYEANLEYLRDWLYNRNKWLLSEWKLSSEITAKSGNFSTQNGYFIQLKSEKTSVSSLLADYNGTNSVYRKGSQISGSTYAGNGCILTKGGASYAIILRGDVNGNGRIDSGDYALIKRTVLKSNSLGYLELKSADVNGNGRIDSGDYAMIKRHALGTVDIYK